MSTKIMTLIPAYKTKYLKDLLLGLAVQTRPSELVIISDDSPNGEFTKLLNSTAFSSLRNSLPIEIHPGPKKGAYENFMHLVKLWDHRSDFVHLLLDDDVIYPEFYEFHLVTHASGQFSASISGRWYANEAGQPIRGMQTPREIRAHAGRLLALYPDVLFRTTVPWCNNWLGEFSNCVLTAASADLLNDPQFAGVTYTGLWDLGAFLAASLQAPIGYIQERLGYFRTGPDQQSANLLTTDLKAGHLAWIALAIAGHRLGRLRRGEIKSCAEWVCSSVKRRYQTQSDMLCFIPILESAAAGSELAVEDFLSAWNTFLATVRSVRPEIQSVLV